MAPDNSPDLPDLSSTPAVPDLQALLQQASAMQGQLMAAQEELEDSRVEASSGGGLVTATVTGTGDLVALRIDPSACDPADAETLADLVVAAVQRATSDARDVAASTMAELTGGFGGEFPLGPSD